MSDGYSASVEELRNMTRRLDGTRTLALRLQAMCAGEQAGEEHQLMRATVWRALALSYRQAFARTDPEWLLGGLDDGERAAHEEILREGQSYVAGRAPTPPAALPDGGRAEAAARLCNRLLEEVDAERHRVGDPTAGA